MHQTTNLLKKTKNQNSEIKLSSMRGKMSVNWLALEES